MIRKLLFTLALALCVFSSHGASAQNTTCSTRPNTDNSNACASTQWVNNALTTVITAACTVSPSACATFYGYVNVQWMGAKGDCATDDTAAFQAAENLAVTKGPVFIPPPPTTCYLVGAINATNHSNVTWKGVGSQSVLKVNAVDANGNWIDVSGSSNREFYQMKWINNPSVVPNVLLLWSCTGVGCATSGLLSGLVMDHVDIYARANIAFLYAYGYGCVAGAACPQGGSLSLAHGFWATDLNITTTPNAYLTAVQMAPLHLTAQNDRSVCSVYTSPCGSGAATAWRGLIYDMNFVDFSNGASRSNNSAAVFYNVTQLRVISGSFQSISDTTVGQYSNTENIEYSSVSFIQPNGADQVTKSWIYLGLGANTYLTCDNCFTSDPANAAIVIGPAIAPGSGGTWGMNIRGNNINTTHPLVGTDASGCGGWNPASMWIAASYFELQPAGAGITTCGSVDTDVIVQGKPTGAAVTVPGGATDGSFRVPGGVSFGNPTASIGLTAINGVATTAMRSDAAPALSQAIVPIWTGKHTFSGTIVNGGNISAPAWTTGGLMYSGTGGTHTDTTSSGTVAAAYDNLIGGGTIAATNPTTFTNYFGMFIKEPAAGTNVTLSNKFALGAESAKIGTTGTWAFSSIGAATATSASAAALAVGLNGATNPAFQVDASTASQAAGIDVIGAATGGTVTIATIDSGANTNLQVNAKGAGAVSVGATSGGGVNLGAGGGNTTINGHVVVEGVTSTGATGTGKLVFDTAPTITNGTLATRLNKGVYVVCMSAATGMTITGTLTETTLATCAIPANAMGANGALRITTQWSKTGTAGTVEPRIKFGGTAFMDNGASGATVISGRQQTEIHNRNATNSQIGTSIAQANWGVQVTTASITSAIDTTSSQNVTFTCQLGNTGDTCELSSYTVELLEP